MSEDPDNDKKVINDGSEAGGPGEHAPEMDETSLMAQLRAMREEAKGDKYLDVDLPGYKGLLVARFRPYPVAKAEAKTDVLRKKMGKRPILLQLACDTLTDACDEIFVRKTPASDLVSIDDTTPVQFDSRLAEYLGIKGAATARQVVIETFPTEQAILDLSNTVGEWLKDTTAEVDEELLGE